MSMDDWYLMLEPESDSVGLQSTFSLMSNIRNNIF